jgi:hypothetical protein
MKDFFFPPPKWLLQRSQPLAEWMGLPSLPAHVHELLGAALLYSIVFYPVSPLISNLVARRYYSTLSRKKRLNWDAHVVSMVQSLLINGMALYIMVFDEERKVMDREERVWGYTGSGGCLQAMAAGYFLWDLIVTSLNLDVFGLGTLAHALAALLVYIFGFVWSRSIQLCNNSVAANVSRFSDRLSTTMDVYSSCGSSPRLFSIFTGSWIRST